LTKEWPNVIQGWERAKKAPRQLFLPFMRRAAFFLRRRPPVVKGKNKKNAATIFKKSSGFWIFRLTANRQQFMFQNTGPGDRAMRGRNPSTGPVPFGKI